MKNFENLPLYDKLLNKIYAYYHTIWNEKWREGIDQDWLGNFSDDDDEKKYRERVNMLYLLSKFIYFGNKELRQLLLSLFRDLFKYPIIAEIRRANNDTRDQVFINQRYEDELNCTRFLGVGNPSESGVHMLYYFRQECKLSKKYFINTSEIFNTSKFTEQLYDQTIRTYLKSEIGNKEIKRYIFIDDFCGSGSQASGYLKQLVENIKFENPKVEVNYLMLIGTESGICNVRGLNIFNKVEAVFTLDETFKVFSKDSRYFKNVPEGIIDQLFSKETVEKYEDTLCYPSLGFSNCELLLGLYHNTPDNTLPIFWSELNEWKPIFKRYHKIY